MTSLTVSDYEVFRNEKDALAFFFFHHPELDQNPAEGPFWFSIHDSSTIQAGTPDHHVFFAEVKPDVLETARQRGVIMLMEFEGQQPVRCTPCYLSETL